MAWTAPMTVTSGQMFTASAFNTHVRDNLLATEPAMATGGGTFSSTGANAITEGKVGYARIDTAEDTSSNTLTNLKTVGPVVTVKTGKVALVNVMAEVTNVNAFSTTVVTFGVTGATTIAPMDSYGFAVDGLDGRIPSPTSSGMTYAVTNLNPGTNTFTMKYRAASGRATFAYRVLSVIPL